MDTYKDESLKRKEYYQRNKVRLKAEALKRYEADKDDQKLRMRERYDRQRQSVETYNASSNRRARLAEYGLTPEAYMQMYEAQQGLCAICNNPETAKARLVLAVDHDHKRARLESSFASGATGF
jgi:hypothetical protein